MDGERRQSERQDVLLHQNHQPPSLLQHTQQSLRGSLRCLGQAQLHLSVSDTTASAAAAPFPAAPPAAPPLAAAPLADCLPQRRRLGIGRRPRRRLWRVRHRPERHHRPSPRRADRGAVLRWQHVPAEGHDHRRILVVQRRLHLRLKQCLFVRRHDVRGGGASLPTEGAHAVRSELQGQGVQLRQHQGLDEAAVPLTASTASTAAAAAAAPLSAAPLADCLPKRRRLGAPRRPNGRLGRVRHRPGGHHRPSRQQADRGAVLRRQHVPTDGNGHRRIIVVQRRLHLRLEQCLYVRRHNVRGGGASLPTEGAHAV